MGGTLDPVVLCRRRSVADEWFGRALRPGEPRAALGGWFLLAAGVLHDHRRAVPGGVLGADPRDVSDAKVKA